MNDYVQKISRFDFKQNPVSKDYFGPDGYEYETIQQAMYYGQLGLCGCGRPEEVHEFLIKCLSATYDDYPDNLSLERIAYLVRQNSDTASEFILHYLQKENLTEHGGSVYGSWLSDRGKQFIEIGPMAEEL